MKPTKELIDAIYRDKVKRARRVAPEVKFMLGAELFDYACEIARWGIRSQHPNSDDAQVEAELRRRLKLRERLEART